MEQKKLATIGVFGGSGFYKFLDNVEEVKVETPKFYIWSEIDGYKRRVWVSLNKINSY